MRVVDHDVLIVQGARTRYACRSVAEIDAHLAGLTRWLARSLPGMHAGQRRAVEVSYGRDIDQLLHARAMLASLATLDDDLAALGTMTP